MVGVFDDGREDLVSILGRLMPKLKKMVLDASLLNIHHYKVGIKSEWSNLGKE